MLSFLKRIFRKEQSISQEKVELTNLSPWFDEKTAPKIDELNSELAKVSQRVLAEKQQTIQHLDTLNKAELMNSNIPERAKHYMKGNREAYHKKVSLFLDKIQPPQKIEDLPVFHSVVQKELKELMQGTAKSFQIMQEFFANESRQVMTSIGNIEREINAFKQAFDTAGLDVLDSTKNLIVDVQTKTKLKKALETDLETRKKEKEIFSSELKQLQEDIELLQKDRELNEIKDKLKQTKAKGEEVRERIALPFSVINPALRKFERITYRHRVTVQKYIESPLDALMQDLHLGILKTLQDLEKSILNNRIDLRDKKRDKTLEVLKLLTKEYLGSFLSEYGHIKKEQDKLIKQMNALNVIQLLKEKKERIKTFENNRIDIERKIDLFSKELEKVHLLELEEKLLGNLKKITNTQVKIV
ncbi:hypothetical protein KY333_01080 [Candidatus Woesearchaeota archaeon]|nr:hypothetical protein [Candidatus Woesearchaeota archaeon]MBW2994553.1 hypothetical protein [Candidatus Woesearchaeota archaeon]